MGFQTQQRAHIPVWNRSQKVSDAAEMVLACLHLILIPKEFHNLRSLETPPFSAVLFLRTPVNVTSLCKTRLTTKSCARAPQHASLQNVAKVIPLDFSLTELPKMFSKPHTFNTPTRLFRKSFEYFIQILVLGKALEIPILL